jgi:hypothetical protein
MYTFGMQKSGRQTDLRHDERRAQNADGSADRHEPHAAVDKADAEDGDGADGEQQGHSRLGSVAIAERADQDARDDGGADGGEVGHLDLVFGQRQALLDDRHQRRHAEPRIEGLGWFEDDRRERGGGGVRRQQPSGTKHVVALNPRRRHPFT